MTLWIGVDYTNNHYRIVAIENFQVQMIKQLNHHEFVQFSLLNKNAQWVVGISHHAIYCDSIQCRLNTSLKDCHLILQQQYAYDYHRYQFCLFYLGRQSQEDVWRVARVSRDYLQEYLTRYNVIAHQLKVIESDIEAIWIWIYALFKDFRFGTIIYQHGTQIYALVGKNDLILDLIVGDGLESIIEQMSLSIYPLQWICFFNVPNQAVPGYEEKIVNIDIGWRMPMALAYRGACIGL